MLEGNFDKIKKSKKVLKDKVSRLKMRTMLTLTYPEECYPYGEKEGGNIRQHVKKLTRLLSKKGEYVYVYELDSNGDKIHVHILTTIEATYVKFFYRLKKKWNKIIGAKERMQALHYAELRSMEKSIEYILKNYEREKNKELEELRKRLGVKSRLIGGSIVIMKELKELRQTLYKAFKNNG